MTVELVADEEVKGQGPFVWPAEPTDWQPWMKEQWAKAKDDQEKQMKEQQQRGRFGRAWPGDDIKEVGGRAAELLKKAGRGKDPV